MPLYMLAKVIRGLFLVGGDRDSEAIVDAEGRQSPPLDVCKHCLAKSRYINVRLSSDSRLAQPLAWPSVGSFCLRSQV